MGAAPNSITRASTGMPTTRMGVAPACGASTARSPRCVVGFQWRPLGQDYQRGSLCNQVLLSHLITQRRDGIPGRQCLVVTLSGGPLRSPPAPAPEPLGPPAPAPEPLGPPPLRGPQGRHEFVVDQ